MNNMYARCSEGKIDRSQKLPPPTPIWSQAIVSAR
jgi:hypothetical protein